MSRIDEALRRRDTAGRIAPVAPVNRQGTGVFVSAWPLEVGERTEETEPKEHAAPPREVHARTPEPRTPEPRATEVSKDSLLTLGRRAPSILGFSGPWREVMVTNDSNPVVVEQFRRLAATLHHAQAANGIRRLLITSAAAGDGKTMTAMNLAIVLSQSYSRSVLVIDADLRRPSIGNLANLTGVTGLSEGLKAKIEQKLAVVELTPSLSVLPAGQPDPDPIVGLSSPRMRRILEESAACFDWVIVDAPPVGPVADASLLAEMVDGAIFVIRAGHTQFPAIQKALEVLGRERVLGVVVNGADPGTNPDNSGYYKSGTIGIDALNPTGRS